MYGMNFLFLATVASALPYNKWNRMSAVTTMARRAARFTNQGGGSPLMRHKHLLPVETSNEPVGIVIADGGRGDLPTRFSAFVWGPVPDDVVPFVEEPKELVAAHS